MENEEAGFEEYNMSEELEKDNVEYERKNKGSIKITVLSEDGLGLTTKHGNATAVQVSFFGDNALTTTDADRIAQFVPKMEMEIDGDNERILLGSRSDLDAFHEEEAYLSDDDYGEDDGIDTQTDEELTGQSGEEVRKDLREIGSYSNKKENKTAYGVD